MLLKKNFKFSKKNVIIVLSMLLIILSILYIVMYNNKTNDKKLIEGFPAIPSVDDFTVEDIAKDLRLYPLSNYTAIDIDNRVKENIDMTIKNIDIYVEKTDKKYSTDEVREYKKQLTKQINDAGEKLKNALPPLNDNTPSYLSLINGVESSKSSKQSEE